MTVTPTCAACHDKPAPKDATICRACRRQLEQNLGDIGALIVAADRVWRSISDRTRGSDESPLVTSRRRGTVVDPKTDMRVPEPFRSGEFGRTSPVPWDADHGLGRDLDISLSRQAALGRREGPRSSGRPLPYSTRASKVGQETARRLDHWVRVLHDGTEAWPLADIAATSRWLLARTARAVVHPAADEFERDVHRVVARLRHAVDRPADRWYAGPCDTSGCVEEQLTFDDDGRPVRTARQTALYADPELSVVVCPRCRTEYDVEARRQWLLDAAQDQLAHAELIGRAAPALGVEITPSAIRGYAARGRISAHSVDEQGRPLYRVGDVIDVAQDVLARQAERQAKAQERRDKAQEKRSRRSA